MYKNIWKRRWAAKILCSRVYPRWHAVYQAPHSSSELAAVAFFLVDELALARTELEFVEDLFFARGVLEAEVGVCLPLMFSSVGCKLLKKSSSVISVVWDEIIPE